MTLATPDNPTRQRNPNALQRALQDDWNQSGGPKYPHEKVVQFCFRSYPPAARPQTHALDMGCGSGVHTVFLAAEGFHATGIDVSSTGIANTQRKLEQAGLCAELRVESIETPDFPPASFDLVLCVGVLECAGHEIARRAVKRVSSLLRPGGKGLFIFASDRDFRVVSDPPQVYHGYSRSEVEEIFAEDFHQVWIDRYITTYRGEEIEQNDWLVTLQK